MVNKTFNGCIQGFDSDKAEEQDQQKTVVEKSGPRDGKDAKAEYQQQNDMPERRLLPEPAQTPDRIARCGKNMGNSGDTFRFRPWY